MEAAPIPLDGAAGFGEALSTPASQVLHPLSLLQGIRDQVISGVNKRTRSILADEEREENRYTPLNNFHPSKTPGSRIEPPPSKKSPPSAPEAPSPNKAPRKKLKYSESEAPVVTEELGKLAAEVFEDTDHEDGTVTTSGESLAGSSKRVRLGRPFSLPVIGAATQAKMKEVSRLEGRGATQKAAELLKETRSEGNDVSSDKNVGKKAANLENLLFELGDFGEVQVLRAPTALPSRPVSRAAP